MRFLPLLLFAALRVCAQPSAFAPDLTSSSVFFDDLDYAHPVDWISPRGGSYGSLYGENAWLVGNASGVEVETVRAWFSSNGWLDFGNWLTDENARNIADSLQSIATQSTDEPGWIVLESSADRPARSLLGFSSGFEAATGTWVARVRMSPMQPNTSSQTAVAHTPLWLQSSNSARDLRMREGLYVSRQSSWSEINFEINNWWSQGCEDGPSKQCRVSSGVTWGHLTPDSGNRAMRAPGRLATQSPSAAATCRVVADPGGYVGARIATDVECARILTNSATQGGDVYAYVLIRITPTRSFQAIAAFDETRDGYRRDRIPGFESLYMETPGGGLPHYAPPGAMRMISSLLLEQDQPFATRMETDWMFYAPDTTLSIRDAMGDVDRLRAALAEADVRDRSGRPITRVNTTGLGLRNPHAYRDEADRTCYDSWLTQTPDLPARLRIDGPFATPQGPVLRAYVDQPYEQRFSGTVHVAWQGWTGADSNGAPTWTRSAEGLDLLLTDTPRGTHTIRATLSIEGPHSWRDWSTGCPDDWFTATAERTIRLR